MSEARFTVTIPNLSHDAAAERADAIDEDLRLDPLAVTISETDETAETWALSLYFATVEDAMSAVEVLADPCAIILPVPTADWVKQSLEGLPPVAAGRYFIHGSHDRAKRRSGGVSLEIDAGTAFGTGHHGTTEGCLMALDRLMKHRRPRRILDVGCGTGVLAIAAAKATGNRTLASDIDPEAERVTRANARRNGVAILVQPIAASGLHHRQIASRAPYDLIFANILARPLVALAQGIVTALAPGGHLVLSGLTRDQETWVAAAYRNRGLLRQRRIVRGHWVTLVFLRPTSKSARQAKAPGASSHLHGGGWLIES